MMNEMESHEYKRVPIEDIDVDEELGDREGNQKNNHRYKKMKMKIKTRNEEIDNDTKNRNTSQKSITVAIEMTDNKNERMTSEESFDAYIFLLHIGKKKKRIGINSDWRVLQIKQKYFESELLEGKNVRLIYRGKMLDDYKFVLDDYQISDGCHIHVSVANNIGHQSQMLKESELRKPSHADMNEIFDDGLNDEEIAQRLQAAENRNFHNRHRSSNANANANNHELISMRDLESLDMGHSLWNDRIHDGNNDNGNGENNNNNNSNSMVERRDFICGFFLGLMVGVWVYFILLFVRRSYSRRFRLGVLGGVMLNYHDRIIQSASERQSSESR